MRLTWQRLKTFSLVTLTTLAIAPEALAGVTVDLGGDSRWGITAKATTWYEKHDVGTWNRGTAEVIFTAKVLNLPVPVTGHYVNSFPKTYHRPKLIDSHGDIESALYSSQYNQYLGKHQWEIRGSKSFFGSYRAEIGGSGRAASRGYNQYFHAGTSANGNHSIDANALRRMATE